MDKIKQQQKLDILIIIVIGLATILSRWPFQFMILNNHDAVNYALALDHFDMRLHQPQPPGYPLYILLGRLFYVIFSDHRAALIWLSMVFSGLGVMVIYWAGREMFERRVGFMAALLLATSSLFWSQGEIAAPYTTDLFVSVIVGWLCYRLSISPGRRLVWGAAAAIGLAGAFRLQTMVFLFPLFLYALRQRPWRTIAGAVAVAGGIFGFFFVPAVVVSGGPVEFVRAMRTTVPVFWSADTVARSVTTSRYLQNIKMIGEYTFRALGELVLPLVLVGCLTRPSRWRFWREPILLLFAIWLAPIWLVYLLVWPGNVGTILVSLPPLFLLAAAGLNWIMSRPSWGLTVGSVLLAVILSWNVILFIALPQYPFGESYRRFDNRETVVAVTQYYQNKLSLMREIPVEGTLVYADAFRHLQYYLPQYTTFSAPSLRRDNPSVVKSIVAIKNGLLENWSEVEVTALVPPKTERIVWFDLPREALLVDPALVEERTKNGETIYILSVPANDKVVWTPAGLTIKAAE